MRTATAGLHSTAHDKDTLHLVTVVVTISKM
jgi:hypothetical protein